MAWVPLAVIALRVDVIGSNNNIQWGDINPKDVLHEILYNNCGPVACTPGTYSKGVRMVAPPYLWYDTNIEVTIVEGHYTDYGQRDAMIEATKVAIDKAHTYQENVDQVKSEDDPFCGGDSNVACETTNVFSNQAADRINVNLTDDQNDDQGSFSLTIAMEASDNKLQCLFADLAGSLAGTVVPGVDIATGLLFGIVGC